MRLVVPLLVLTSAMAPAAAPPPAVTSDRQQRIDQARIPLQKAMQASQKNQPQEAASLFQATLEARLALYPPRWYPYGHPELADIHHQLTQVYFQAGQVALAEQHARRTLEIHTGLYPTRLYPEGHADLQSALVNLAAILHSRGDSAASVKLFQQGLIMAERLYPAHRHARGHPEIALALNNLGEVFRSQGDLSRAEPLLRRSLTMQESLAQNDATAEELVRLTGTMNNLGLLYQAQGEYAQAHPLFVRALVLREKLYPAARYPDGHPNLANSLTSLARLYQAEGAFARAEPLFTRALAMTEKLFPPSRFPFGHPRLAQCLNSLAWLYQEQKGFERAEPLLRRALEMTESLYPPKRFPRGHPDIVRRRNNLAGLLYEKGDYRAAGPLYTQALAMLDNLYPRSDHPLVSRTLANLAALRRAEGDVTSAERLYRRAYNLTLTQAISQARTLEEATALNTLAQQPLLRDGYLTVTRNRTGEDAYWAVWEGKAALSRVFAQRHLAALAAESSEARQLWEADIQLRRLRERLVLAPADPARVTARDTQLSTIDEKLREIRERLTTLIPLDGPFEDGATRKPEDLQRVLPPDVAFIDWLRYTRIEQDPKNPGIAGERRTAHHVAFIVTRKTVVRVETPEASDLESLLDQWRKKIIEGADEEPTQATAIYRAVWAPVMAKLPAEIRRVYISPDAALARLPWPALRNEEGQRLLERYTLAVVPHGRQLLANLTRPATRPAKRASLLLVGGVRYDSAVPATTVVGQAGERGPAAQADFGPALPTVNPVTPGQAKKLHWRFLPGTRRELDDVARLAAGRTVIRREGEAASAEQLLLDLPRVEMAHLATHGFFADEQVRALLALDSALFERSERADGGTNRRIGVGARHPLVLSGLVCTGANRADTPNRGILTAASLVGLDLRRLYLAVLSACETNLGETVQGEGVHGLTHALHLAGCQNVVASLWKVDDEATAALMSLFYRQLWQAREPIGPAEALRRAQLALLREPERIAEWAQGRGPMPGSSPAKHPGGHTRLWAAFLLSGLGD
ncbi:MAG: CHAT domain-containing tetratricopeptide repeat protein [Gemmataceae bacterium]